MKSDGMNLRESPQKFQLMKAKLLIKISHLNSYVKKIENWGAENFPIWQTNENGQWKKGDKDPKD